MKKKILTRKIDNLGRITIPSDLRKNLNITEAEELEIVIDGSKIVLRKQNNFDIFGNPADENSYFEYHGNKVSKTSIIELSKIAGLID